MADQNNGLEYIEQLLRDGKKQEGRTALVQYVQSHPDSSRAWWMLSFILTDPKQQLDCVERVLKLDPGNIPARNRLLKLQSDLAPKSDSTFSQEPSRLHPITAPFITDDESAPQTSSNAFEASFLRQSQGNARPPEATTFLPDDNINERDAFNISDSPYQTDNYKPSPFFPEDDLDLQSAPPLSAFERSYSNNPSPDPYQSSSIPPLFLPEDEDLPRPSADAFEHSFGQDAYEDPYSSSVSPFQTETQSADKPAQSARKKPAPKKKNDFVKYVVLIVVFLCVFGLILVGFFFVLRGQQISTPTAAPIFLGPTETPTTIPTIGLPPTWTPAPSPTLFPTSTLGYIESTPTPLSNVIGTSDPNSEQGSGLSSGMQAPDFTLKNVNTGNEISLSDYRGKPVVLFFWVGNCGYCDTEADAMQEIYNQYKENGIVVLAVDVWGDSDHARTYRDVRNLTYPILVDPKGSVFKKYGGTNMFPVNYFVDADGNILFGKIGMMDYSTLNMNMRMILNLIPTVAP